MKKLNILSSFVTLLLSCHAYAAQGDTFGLGPRANSLVRSSSSTYAGLFAPSANPAALSLLQEKSGYMGLIGHDLKLDNVNSKGQDVATSGIPKDNYLHENAASLNNTVMGLALPLGHLFTFGVSAQMPLDHFARVHAFTGNEVTYLNFNDRQTRPEIYTAASFKLPYGFSLGAGMYYSVKARGELQLAISSTDAESRLFMELKPMLIPYGGLLWRGDLSKNLELALGGYYRTSHKADSVVTVDTRFNIFGTATFPFLAASKLVAFYDPALINFGAGLKLFKRFGLYGSLERARWSKYKAPVIDLSGPYLDDLNGGAIESDPITLDDTWSYHLGLEATSLLAAKHWSIDALLGFEYTESALKDPPTSIAVVDADRWGVGAGSKLHLDKLLFIESPVSFSLGMRWTKLKSKTITISSKSGQTLSANIGGDVFSLFGGAGVEF